MRKRMSVQQLTRIAVLSALGSILFMIEVPIVSFYKLDFSNLPVLLGGFSMGTGAGMMILLVKSLLGLLHSGTGGVGELADFLMGAAMLLPSAMIYQRSKSRMSAVYGMIAGTAVMIVVASVVNWALLFPLLTKSYPTFEFILTVTAPFNLLKGIAISVVTYLIYKPLSPLLHVRK